MVTANQPTDEDAIRALIADQFDCLRWSEGSSVNWRRLYSGFIQDASLYPARRPARYQSPQEFSERLRRLRSSGALHSFSEKGVGCEVFVIGNVAVAIAGCEMTENEDQVTRDVSCFLLVKDPEGCKIAAQAWDYVDDIPKAFKAAGLL